MNVLMVDKFYFLKGGAERYAFELTAALERRGHAVVPFAMKHARNLPSAYSEFFVKEMAYDLRTTFDRVVALPGVAGRMLYSLHGKKQLEKLLLRVQIDVAHIHMVEHQISPSILHTLRHHGIPVIQTVHNYKLVCPNYQLFNPRTGRICEKCMKGNLLHPVLERCHKGSIGAGMLVALEGIVHRATGLYEKNVAIFHAPSAFMAATLERGGVGRGRVRQMKYCLDVGRYSPRFDGEDYILYCGRLSAEKGIRTLLEAIRGTRGIHLRIVGEGPLRSNLKAQAETLGSGVVSFEGEKSGSELAELVRNCRFLVVPSEWHENSPLVVYEAFAFGKPVVASRRGGIPELVEEGRTGMLFDAANVESLREKIVFLAGRPELASEWGRAARDMAEKEFAAEPHVRRVEEWYGEMIRESGREK